MEFILVFFMICGINEAYKEGKRQAETKHSKTLGEVKR